MSLSAREQQALESIEDGLAESDPGLASRLGMFSRLASGEEMPERDEIQPIRPSATDRLDRNRSPRRIVVLGARAGCADGWAGIGPRCCCGFSSPSG
jgi:hypothetical protein